MANVKYDRVTKRFGNMVAVNDLSLEIADKEFMTLVGPSGCGKTTTLNLLAGLEEPDAGEISIGDHVVNDIPPGERNIAMVFQSYALYPHMKVFENIAFGLRIQKRPQEEIQASVNEAAELLSITDLLSRKPAQLSGGQRQRVALGRAIVRHPDVFLLDEPLSNLDAILRIQMRADLRLLFNRLGSTVVYVTHDQAEAMTMSDRLAVFYAGVIQQVGTPLGVYEQPMNMFVARFIGSPSINFVRGRMVSNDGGYRFTADEQFTIDLPAGIVKAAWPAEVVIGIRPEDISLGPTDDGIRVQVELMEQLGAETILHTTVGSQKLVLKLEKGTSFQYGENVTLLIPPRQIHFFDPTTEQRLE
jgi:multiple sugar transport system ATP-binding protein